MLGLEYCDKISRRENSASGWEEEGRRFILSQRSNNARTYLLCSVRDTSGKRFSIVVPEGRGLTNGWLLLAKKLRHLGIVVRDGSKVGDFVGEVSVGPL